MREKAIEIGDVNYVESECQAKDRKRRERESEMRGGREIVR
jgi:hypothetical protein